MDNYDGNDLSPSNLDNYDEEKHDSNYENTEDYQWNITNLQDLKKMFAIESPFYIYSNDEIEFRMKLDLRKNHYSDDEIYIILKSLPANIKQLSLKCEIKIEEFNLNLLGILHFKQTKLKAKITNFKLKKSDMKEMMTMTIRMHTIANYH